MIFYALICRIDGTILVEGTSTGLEGNFPQITQTLVEFLKEKPAPIATFNSGWEVEPVVTETIMQCELYDGGRRTFVTSNDNSNGFFCGDVSDLFHFSFCAEESTNDKNSASSQKYYFHTGREKNLIFLCLTDDMSGKKHQANFAFLEDIHAAFKNKYSQSKIKKAISYEMEKSFSHVIRSTMHKYNTDPMAGSSHSVAALHAQIDDLKNVMGQNIHILLQRGDSIESLIDRADMLTEKANVFRRNSSFMKETVETRSRKYEAYTCISICITILIILYIIASKLCGLTMEQCLGDFG